MLPYTSPLTKAESNHLRIYHNEFADTHYSLEHVSTGIFHRAGQDCGSECMSLGERSEDAEHESISGVDRAAKTSDFSLH